MTTGTLNFTPVAEWDLTLRSNTLLILLMLDAKGRLQYGEQGITVTTSAPPDPLHMSEYEAENIRLALQSPNWEGLEPATWDDGHMLSDLWLLTIAYGYLNRKRAAKMAGEKKPHKLPRILRSWLARHQQRK